MFDKNLISKRPTAKGVFPVAGGTHSTLSLLDRYNAVDIFMRWS